MKEPKGLVLESWISNGIGCYYLNKLIVNEAGDFELMSYPLAYGHFPCFDVTSNEVDTI